MLTPEDESEIENLILTSSINREDATKFVLSKREQRERIEQERIIAEAEQARVAVEIEQARLIKEAEQAKIAAEAEQERLIKEARSEELRVPFRLKVQYLTRIRKQSMYSALRSIIEFIYVITLAGAIVASAIGIIIILIALGAPHDASGQIGLGFAVIGGGVLLSIASIVTKQASLLLVDIADSLIDLNYRYDHQQ